MKGRTKIIKKLLLAGAAGLALLAPATALAGSNITLPGNGTGLPSAGQSEGHDRSL